MSTSHPTAVTAWPFYHFGLIVTGEAERECLPALFRSIAATGKCRFEVIRRVGQRSAIRSAKRQLKMVGSGKEIPDRDATDIGLPARRHLLSKPGFVVLVDDLEADRSDDVDQVFARYRLALDTMLKPDQVRRASVHFLVNMLEAYFFADIETVNRVLGTDLEEHEGDVEEIRNPKADLKRHCSGYDEKEDGPRIVEGLDIPRVLSRKETCASLRTMFAWVWRAIGEPKSEEFQLRDGRYYEATKSQICSLPPI